MISQTDLKSNIMEDEKIYLMPGDLVTLRQALPNKPTMLVVRKKTLTVKGEAPGKFLQGIVCRWFTTDGLMQEELFSTKDLIKI